MRPRRRRGHLSEPYSCRPDMQDDTPLDVRTAKALLFALATEQMKTWYEHGVWLSTQQGVDLAAQWLYRYRRRLALPVRRRLAEMAGEFARELAGTLSREAGLYTAHAMEEALDPNHLSGVASDLQTECERLVLASGLVDPAG
jgi:hypothetical protein